MSAMEVLLVTAFGLAATLIVGHQITDRQVKRLQRELDASEAEREAAHSPAE